MKFNKCRSLRRRSQSMKILGNLGGHHTWMGPKANSSPLQPWNSPDVIWMWFWREWKEATGPYYRSRKVTLSLPAFSQISIPKCESPKIFTQETFDVSKNWSSFSHHLHGNSQACRIKEWIHRACNECCLQRENYPISFHLNNSLRNLGLI